ncbi:MAG: DUF4373 domain-containing protein [Rectinema subterraneum]|uniref:DUF4373 domain-containing protein n=1 Tax=Rectinema subterraneum TaxID=2653714 RepID=UPI003C7C7A29
MARRLRHGLDYFPLDTSWDLSMRLLKAQFGLEGLGAAIQLLQMIYREGYYIEWNSETRQLFCEENRIEETKLDVILKFCIEHGLFNRELYDQHAVLTSRAIQRQWLRICTNARRRNAIISEQLNLCKETSDEFDVQKSGNIRKESGNMTQNSGNIREFSGNNRENSRNITQKNGNIRNLGTEIKEKKIKENKRKENKSTAPEVCTQPAQTRFEIPALIQALAKEKRAFSKGPPDNTEPISIKFQKLIRKGKSQ